jgi:hypothetical protein
MKSTRTILAAIVFVVTAAACNANPVGPNPGEAPLNVKPVIGSGVGGG